MSKAPEIIFHVGLGKTGSSYLQQHFFPKLKGIHYIPTSRYRFSPKIITKRHHQKYLVSREFDRQFDREVEWFSAMYPDARPVMVLRRHDSWIASQYRRQVKNGGQYSFDEFIDVEQNTGVWDKKELNFFRKIEKLESAFSQKPLVLLYDELRSSPHVFFDKIASFCGATYDKQRISLKPSHKSYNEKQLKYIRRISPKLVKSIPNTSSNRVIQWFQYRSRWLLLHLVLYIALILPEKPVANDVLIEPKALDKIRHAYADDWQKCLDYISKA